MITEDYVSFETAKLLKEKGFKEWCYKSYGTAVYHKGVPISFDEECELKEEGLEYEIEYVEGGYLYDFGCDNRKKDAKVWAAPTIQMTMKWLRKKGIYITIVYGDYPSLKKVFWTPQIDSLEGFDLSDNFYKEYDEYEEAVDAAVKYCLENLI